MIDFKLEDEPARLAAMRRYGLDSASHQPAFEKVISLVRSVLAVPICAVMLIGSEEAQAAAAFGMPRDPCPREQTLCNIAIRQRAPMIIENAPAEADYAEIACVRGGAKAVGYAGVPLATADGYNVGTLCAIDTRPRHFTAAEIEILSGFAAIICEAMELRTMAHRDYLTGALTRRAFAEDVNDELERERRYARDAALAALDLDHFKVINDRLGHAAGDCVLRAVSAELQSLLRPSDRFGRVGGEEFAILLPETGRAEAVRCVERLRAAVEALDFPDYPGLKVTASFGVSMYDPKADSFDAWLAGSDSALYAAKHRGRNRCILLPERLLQTA